MPKRKSGSPVENGGGEGLKQSELEKDLHIHMQDASLKTRRPVFGGADLCLDVQMNIQMCKRILASTSKSFGHPA